MLFGHLPSLHSLHCARSLAMTKGKRKAAGSPQSQRKMPRGADDSFVSSGSENNMEMEEKVNLLDEIDKLVNSKGGASKHVKLLLSACSELLRSQQHQLDECKGLVKRTVETNRTVETRVGSLEAQVAELKSREAKDNEELNGDSSQKVRSRAPSVAPEAGFEEGCRTRSLVLKGLSLPPKHQFNSQEWAKAVRNQVEDLLAYLKVPFLPIDVFPMGEHLIKVRMGTKEAQKLVISRAKWLKGSELWWRVFIRPSLSETERTTRAGNFNFLLREKQSRERLGESLTIRPKLNSWVEFELVERRPRALPRNTTRYSQNISQSNYQ